VASHPAPHGFWESREVARTTGDILKIKRDIPVTPSNCRLRGRIGDSTPRAGKEQ
jgi:hypothetical protein